MNKQCDVLIVGTGVSALYSCLNLSENTKIIMVSKGTVKDCNSYLAQGGISTALNAMDIDSFIEDTLIAGQRVNDINSVTVLAEESKDNILKLDSLGVPFDKTSDNTFEYTREGAHSVNRIVHCKDKTGEIVSTHLFNLVKAKPNVEILENCTLCDLIVENRTAIGGYFNYNDTPLTINSKFTVLAMGGIGGLFKSSTNNPLLTADYISIALKHDIEFKNLDYIQIHPTSLYEKGVGKKVLISESLRGESAKLYNVHGESFIDELLPRDVVAKAIFKEMKKTNSPYVYLDIHFLEENYLKTRFPLVYSSCLEKGYDITKGPIPVTPCHHYFMGGITVDLDSKTSLKNLYAVGECSCTGVHGKNRLASNSLLEALVFSRREAFDINEKLNTVKLIPHYKELDLHTLNALMKENKEISLEEFKKRSSDLDVEFISD